MSKYAFKKRVSSLSVSSSLNRELYKIVFKTEGDDWVDTKESVVIPFSIHSNFNEGSVGDSKVFTLVSVIREYTQAKITIWYGKIFCKFLIIKEKILLRN